MIVLYYYEDMTLKEISMTLEVSESRVSQLHTKALNKEEGYGRLYVSGIMKDIYACEAKSEDFLPPISQ